MTINEVDVTIAALLLVIAYGLFRLALLFRSGPGAPLWMRVVRLVLLILSAAAIVVAGPWGWGGVLLWVIARSRKRTAS